MMKSLSIRGCGSSIWQPGFHDHAFREHEDIRQAARYVIANPLRAGLVDRVEDWDAVYAVWL